MQSKYAAPRCTVRAPRLVGTWGPLTGCTAALHGRAREQSPPAVRLHATPRIFLIGISNFPGLSSWQSWLVETALTTCVDCAPAPVLPPSPHTHLSG